MSERCWVCEYKRLAREAISLLREVSDFEIRTGGHKHPRLSWKAEELHQDFLDLHTAQADERKAEEAPTIVDGYVRRWE